MYISVEVIPPPPPSIERERMNFELRRGLSNVGDFWYERYAEERVLFAVGEFPVALKRVLSIENIIQFADL